MFNYFDINYGIERILRAPVGDELGDSRAQKPSISLDFGTPLAH